MDFEKIEQINNFLETSQKMRIRGSLFKIGFIKCFNCNKWFEFFPKEKEKCPFCASEDVYIFQDGIEPNFPFTLSSPVHQGTVFDWLESKMKKRKKERDGNYPFNEGV